MTRYESKRDPLFGMLLMSGVIVVLATMIYKSYLDRLEPVALLVMSLVLVLMLLFSVSKWLRTYYWFEGLHLHVVSGLVHRRFALSSIGSVQRGRFLFRVGRRPAIYALSFDRLSLKVSGRWGNRAIIISPEQDKKFITELTQRCPQLQVLGG